MGYMPNLFIAYEDQPTVKFAAMELVRYIKKLTGYTVSSGNRPIKDTFNICLSTSEGVEALTEEKIDFSELKFDGFLLKSFPDKLLITGKIERSVCYGVYFLLEQWGCQWLYPGEEGEFLPEHAVFNFKIDALENPDFEIRGYLEAGSADYPEYNIKETLELIDWSFKNRINSYLRHYPTNAAIPFYDMMVPAVKKRGMLFEYGGHGTQNFVRRELFDTKPELFRMKDGKRSKDGNFCVSNKEACQMICDGVVGVFDQYPDIDILRIWFEDLVDGGWCDCDQCKKYTPAEQVFIITNEVAKAVKLKYPDKYIDNILYHDTLDCSHVSLQPEDNIYGYLAPRERCYAHGIDDTSCRRNRQYYFDAVKALYEKFGKKSYMIEYYADMILYNKMTSDFSDVIAMDLKAYHALGIDKINCLMFNKYSWWAYKNTMFFYNKLCWNVNFDISSVHYAEYLFGKHNIQSMEPIWEGVKEASKNIFQFCEYDILFDIRILPAQSKEFYEKHLKDIEKAIAFFDQAIESISMLLQLETAHAIIARLEEFKNILYISVQEAKATLGHNRGFYGCKFIEGFTQEQLDAELYRTLEIRENLVKYILTLPMDMTGMNGQYGIFINHLCKELNSWCDETRANFGKHPTFNGKV